jgi:hypothetical protein
MLLAASTAFAIPCKVGDFTVDVEVRNQAMNLIPDVKVKCYMVSDRNIMVKAKAPGYQTRTRKIYTQDNQSYYKTDLTLRDIDHRISIVDLNRRPIVSAYARTDQYGFGGNEFGITVFIPKAIWKNAQASEVEVLEPFWGLPFKKNCQITEVDEFYQVKLAISRDALDWSGGDLVVIFKTYVEKDLKILEDRIVSLANLPDVKNKDVIACSLSRFIADNYRVDELRHKFSSLPEPLETIVKDREKFNQLHRENF